MEDKKMLDIIHNNCKKEQLRRHNEQVANEIKHCRRRIRTNILIIIWIILMFFIGLVARIDNNIVSASYGAILLIIMIILKNRIEVK